MTMDEFTKEELLLLSLGYQVCMGMMTNTQFTDRLADFDKVAKSIGIDQLTKTNDKIRRMMEMPT